MVLASQNNSKYLVSVLLSQTKAKIENKIASLVKFNLPLMVFQALFAKDFVEAYNHQSACVACVVRLLQAQKEENWTLPLMYTVCLDLRLVAQKAEACSRK